MGALIYEGLAETPEGAAALAASGEIEFAPCHHHHAVGPMAGIISPSMPVFIVKNEATGHTAYATQNEGLGKVLRYGAYGPEVIRRLKWMETTLYPALQAALAISGPIDLRSMIAQALHMGDECHNRNKAGTSLFIRTIAPALVEAVPDTATVAALLRFMDGNDHFFLNLSMPAMKAMLLPAEGIPGCTLVTTMARNGTDWGIRVSGTGERWFTAPAPLVQGLWLPGFTAADANPDIGDSAITETGGIGGFALAGAPAIVKFVGGTPQDALNATLDMYEICAGEHTAFTIPPLNFRGTPVGIDVRKVMRTGITPWLNTGIAHREPGIGMVGAGSGTGAEGLFRGRVRGAETMIEENHGGTEGTEFRFLRSPCSPCLRGSFSDDCDACIGRALHLPSAVTHAILAAMHRSDTPTRWSLALLLSDPDPPGYERACCRGAHRR